MTNGTFRHPFEAGEQYRNEDGVYTVVRLEDPNMVLQYEDGRMLQSSIKLQKRIWERIQDEEAIAASQVATKKAARHRSGSRGRASLGRDFHGLQETDFRRDVTGTSWRRRTELAGLLAARLSDMSDQIFESHAVYRRAEVYIVQPQHWDSKQPLRAAKFFFGLSENEASYGFYIEKSNEPMDNTWVWPQFIAALTEDKGLQARTLVAMEHCGLMWEIYPDGADVSEPAPQTVSAEQESLYLQTPDDSERSPLDWDGFTDMLSAIPDDSWCNLFLAANIEMARAIESGVGLAQEVANVYDALLPLYEASVKKR